MKKILIYFTNFEKILWISSVILIIISFLIFDKNSFLTLIASLIGVTFLIFNAKGNPIGQFLTIVFGILYGVISYSFRYYGEMITYLCMTAPMALLALISWLKHPYEGKKSQVEINVIRKKEIIFMFVLAAITTFVFYFILDALNTSNIIPSTISVTTSFIAVYLTFRRSHFFSLAYAANDVILVVLWLLASFDNKSYISVLVCFLVFLVNDLYGFFNWSKMKEKQANL